MQQIKTTRVQSPLMIFGQLETMCCAYFATLPNSPVFLTISDNAINDSDLLLSVLECTSHHFCARQNRNCHSI